MSGPLPLQGPLLVVCVSRFFQRLTFVLAVAIFAALGLGFALGEFGMFGVHAGGEQDGAYRQMHVYAEVLKRIQSDYVTEPNINEVTTGALHGLLESLDADSSYLTPDRVQDLQGPADHRRRAGRRDGFQALWLRHHRQCAFPARPPISEHLADGDVIESIGDQSTRELSLAVIRLMLEGKPGTTVTLSVVRPRKPDPDKITLHPHHHSLRRRSASSTTKTPASSTSSRAR